MDRSLDDIDLDIGEATREGRYYSPDRDRSRSPVERGRSRRNGREIDSEEIRKKRVFVANLSYSCTYKELRQFFSDVGTVTWAKVMEKPNGQSKGCGLVAFEDEQTAQEAIRRYNQTRLLGKVITVREDVNPEAHKKPFSSQGYSSRRAPEDHYGRGRDYSTYRDREREKERFRGRDLSPPVTRMSQLSSECTIHISNLDDRVDWQKLKDVFKVVGPVLNIEFYRDNDGKAAIVQFDNPDTAVSAKSLFHLSMLMDKPMVIRTDSRAGPIPDPLSVKLARLNDYYGSSSLGSSSQLLSSLSPLANLSSSLRDRYDRYDKYGGSSRMDHGYDRRDQLESLDSYGQYESLDRYGDRRRDDDSQRSGSYRNFSILGPPPSSERERGGYGSSRTGRQVYVGNLNYQTTWQKLKDHFRKVGKVDHADVYTSSEGKSKGSGYVLYSSRDDAIRAIELLNGSSLDNRSIEVKLDKFA